MAPAAGHKGSALALLVDLMSGGVAGSNFSFEASNLGEIVEGVDVSRWASVRRRKDGRHHAKRLLAMPADRHEYSHFSMSVIGAGLRKSVEEEFGYQLSD